ncbi:unnamed protein product, partial [Nippostrongylus brasiliensis]|uniref:DAZ protein 1 (inferred by orthology to a C. elegans protein) n=1 Tax=Nippostrongylus brasiliensis TaxID=27835 RepID=A0A158QYH6_NIPBR
MPGADFYYWYNTNARRMSAISRLKLVDQLKAMWLCVVHMIPSFASSPVYDMSTGIYYATGATAVIPTPAYELIPHRVFVGGFPASTTELELREHFEQFFTIKEVKVIRSADGVSKGYGFITFDTDDEADTVRGMSPDKLEFKGRKLNLGPALRRMSQRYSTDYAIATPTGLVQSPNYGYTYSFPPQPPFVMVNTPQAYVYTPGSPVPQAMIYPITTPANNNNNAEQPSNGTANGTVEEQLSLTTVARVGRDNYSSTEDLYRICDSGRNRASSSSPPTVGDRPTG